MHLNLRPCSILLLRGGFVPLTLSSTALQAIIVAAITANTFQLLYPCIPHDTMAQTQDALSRNIIDLTDHDQGDSLQILSSAASRAEEAASRLANRFESAVLEKHRMYLAQLTPHRALASSTLSDDIRETPATNRVRRQAAVHASHTLTEVYKTLNPLEEKLQASTTTPKKPGRPKKDEWTPGSHGSRSTEESDVRRRFATEDAISPTSHVGQGLHLDGHRKNSIESPLPSKKRKRPSLSLEPGSPSKLARTGGLQVQDFMPGNGHTSPTSSHEPPLQTIRDCQRVMPPNIPNFRFNSKSINQDFYSDSDLRLAEILEELISTISKNQKRRYKYALSKDQLKSICKAVSRLPQDLNLPWSDYTNLDRSLWKSQGTHCHLSTYMACMVLMIPSTSKLSALFELSSL